MTFLAHPEPRSPTAGATTRQRFLSYGEIELWLLSQLPSLCELGLTRIIGILRGGSFPAVALSHHMGLPVSFMRFDRALGTAEWDSALPPPSAGEHVLLCEDIAGMGLTLATCYEWLAARGCRTTVLTIVDDGLGRMRPNFALRCEGQRMILPWERHIVSPRLQGEQAVLNAANGLGRLAPDHTYQRWGLDLDGVFLDDIPSQAYEDDLPAALQARHLLPLHANAPRGLPEQAVFVTGRPEGDRQMTIEWLRRHGLDRFDLHMRDPARHGPTHDEHARHKIDTALRLGLTHFVESDASQALAIADALPWMHVVHWALAQGAGRWIASMRHEGPLIGMTPAAR